ncbi:MAG: response regulator [Pseudomonadales bacterium]|nr:response regulator [Pseudomonadales bacterium]
MNTGEAVVQECVYESETTLIERAIWHDQNVILKTIKSAAVNPSSIPRYHHEYTINKSITSPYIARVLHLIEGSFQLVFEDIRATSLKELVTSGRLSFDDKLTIATELCLAIQSIHDEGIIHRDINPSNIIYSVETNTLKLIDFGLATFSLREYPESTSANNLTGTLPYISPEQTGRVNRVVDYRTDLYSLGATLFELFSGSPPFNSSDPLELIHFQIARTPPTLQEINKNTPLWLSEIIDKLLSKQPEQRYQSAHSAYTDIESGRTLWEQHSETRNFPLARDDERGQLSLPKRLYGRVKQLDIINDLLDSAKKGNTIMAHIYGAQGMGKARLTDAICANVTERHGLYCCASPLDDSLGGDQAIIQSLIRALFRRALTLPEDQTREILTKLSRIPQSRQARFLSLVPELEYFLDVSQIDNTHPTHSSAIDILRALMQIFSPTPIVVILNHADYLEKNQLDDLLATTAQCRHMLTILCTESSDPAEFTEQTHHNRVVDIPLSLLEKSDVRSMLSDMFMHSEARVRELASEIHVKTDGVPQHILDLLFELYDQDSIYFDTTLNTWSWHLQAIREHYFTDNSRARIELQFSELPEESLNAMFIGSCLGERFPLVALSELMQTDVATTTRHLRQAVSQGLLATVGETSDTELQYQFSHPRVRALTYSKLESDRKQEIHLAIADNLIAIKHHDEETVFSIADHYNIACNPFEYHNERRDQIAHYNLIAAFAAKRRNAFQRAYKYCKAGLALYSQEEINSGKQICRELILNACEAAFLCGDFEQLEHLLPSNTAATKHIADVISLREIKLRSYIARNQIGNAHAEGYACLKILNFKPANQIRIPFRKRIELRPVSANPEILLDAHLKQTFRIICYLIHSGYHAGEPKISNLGIDVIRLSRIHGMSSECAFVYACLAAKEMSHGKFTDADILTENARVLLDQLPEDKFSTRANIVLGGLVDHWKSGLDTTLVGLTQNMRKSIDLQDYEFALTAFAFYSTNALLRGMELGSLNREMVSRIAEVQELGHITALNIVFYMHQTVTSLLGQDEEGQNLSNQLHSVRVNNPEDKAAFAHIFVLRVYYAIIFNDFLGAKRTLSESQKFIDVLVGSPLVVCHTFCAALIEIKTASKNYIQEASKAIKKLKFWEAQGVSFATPKLTILEAELAWRAGDSTLALEHYESAAKSSRALGLANDEALSYELAARQCEHASRSDFARLFVRNAYQAYLRWGALAKVNQMEKEFHSLIADQRQSRTETGSWSVGDLVDLTVRDFTSVSGTYESQELGQRILDTTTVLRAAQTISGEIVLDRVLTKLLRLALEHAGAQKACMLLITDEKLQVEAIATADDRITQRISPPVLMDDSKDVPQSVIQFVARTKQVLALGNAIQEDVFTQDPYIKEKQPLSILCIPILSRNELLGVLYVEHKWLTSVFTSQRVEVLSLLASQAAISIENARLYSNLQSARDEYRALYDNANEGLFRMTSDGQLIRANPTLAHLFGFTSSSQFKDDYRDLLERVFLQKERAQSFMSLLDEHGSATAFEAEGITQDGTTFWMSLNARITNDPDIGEFIDGSVVDITARVARDEAEKNSQIALAASEAKSEFLANMSHEVRTPMNAIIGFSKLTLDSSLERKQYEYVTAIRNSAESLLTIVNDVLDFSKIEAGKLHIEQIAFNLRDTLSDIERLFRIDIRRKGLSFSIDDQYSEHPDYPKEGTLLGDPLRVRQVLVNLVSNALKFTNDGSINVEVSISHNMADSILMGFKVIDTGIGISEKEQLRLFDSFEQAETSTTRTYGGTGLGLAICKQLVGLMGGEISVISSPGEGSCFGFTLLFHHFGKQQKPENPATIAKKPPRQVNTSLLQDMPVLLAEDNPINQQLAIEFLGRAGALVDIAATGQEALDKCLAGNYDVVLMDIHMPIMDGLSATRAIRKAGKTVPIFAVSADALSERRIAAIDAGCNDYITKPIDFDLLMERIREQHDLAESPEEHSRRSGDALQSDNHMAETPEHTDKIGSDFQARPETDRDHEIRKSARQLSDHLPRRVAGIDVGRAIHNHNNNVKLMLKLMHDFGTYYSDAAHKIRADIQIKDYDAAERLAHNLHGVAGSFAADHLKESSKALELALIKRTMRSLPGLVQSFELALNEVLESAESLASEEITFRAEDLGQDKN